MSFDVKTYIKLLTNTVPQVIDSDEEFARVEPIFERLLDKGEKRSPEEDKIFDLLTNLMEDYEQKTLEPIPDASPVEMLRLMMREHEPRQKDLADVFGGQGNVSAVLNGNREITKEQAKILGTRFSLSPLAFL